MQYTRLILIVMFSLSAITLGVLVGRHIEHEFRKQLEQQIRDIQEREFSEANQEMLRLCNKYKGKSVDEWSQEDRLLYWRLSIRRSRYSIEE